MISKEHPSLLASVEGSKDNLCVGMLVTRVWYPTCLGTIVNYDGHNVTVLWSELLTHGEILRIHSNGNVGVGVHAPITRIEIK